MSSIDTNIDIEAATSPAIADPPPKTFRQVAYGLANYLSALATDENRDRAKLAALRRGLGKENGWDPQLASIVNPRIGTIPDRQATICYHVAALFGLHPVGWKRGEDDSARYENRSFTQSLHLLARQQSQEGGRSLDDIKQPLDRRAMALLNADSDDVFDHLRYAVSLLRGSEIPVDWGKLILDLDKWDEPDRAVQRRWSRAWWPAPRWVDGSTSEGAPEATTAGGTDTEAGG
ncbi:MAG: type I-E CRISPR-associated protein Cse2/CasB [Thermomicrobiales bacterium]